MFTTQLYFIFHCTAVASVDLLCLPNGHIRHYMKHGQQEFGRKMTLAVCKQLVGNQGTIAWFYCRTLLKVTERRSQCGLLNPILLPERLTYSQYVRNFIFEVASSPVTESSSGSPRSTGVSPCLVFEKLVFPSDWFVHHFIKFPVVEDKLSPLSSVSLENYL